MHGTANKHIVMLNSLLKEDGHKILIYK